MPVAAAEAAAAITSGHEACAEAAEPMREEDTQIYCASGTGREACAEAAEPKPQAAASAAAADASGHKACAKVAKPMPEAAADAAAADASGHEAGAEADEPMPEAADDAAAANTSGHETCAEAAADAAAAPADIRIVPRWPSRCQRLLPMPLQQTPVAINGGSQLGDRGLAALASGLSSTLLQLSRCFSGSSHLSDRGLAALAGGLSGTPFSSWRQTAVVQIHLGGTCQTWAQRRPVRPPGFGFEFLIFLKSFGFKSFVRVKCPG